MKRLVLAVGLIAALGSGLAAIAMQRWSSTRPLRAVPEVVPGTLPALVREARGLHRQQKYAEAIAIYERALEQAPHSARLHFDRGMSFWKLADATNAARDLTRAIALNPKDPYAHWWRAHVRNRLGEHREAIADVTRTLELDPGLTGAHYHRAVAWLRLGNHAAALADVNAALAAEPDKDCHKQLLARILRAMEKGACEALVAQLSQPLRVAALVLPPDTPADLDDAAP